MPELNLSTENVVTKNILNPVRLEGQTEQYIDLDKYPWPLSSDHFDKVIAENLLQRINDVLSIMGEIYRVSKQGAKIYIVVPWYSSSSAATDYRNVHLFNFTTFDFLLNELEKEGKKFKLIKIEAIPHKEFKWIPNFKIPFLTRRSRDILSTFIGEINQYVYAELETQK